MFKTGLIREAMDLIRHKWGELLDQGPGTLGEFWDYQPERSYCHAWSASPVYHLMQQVLGVKAVEAGWKRVRIAPQTAGLDSARGCVPSIHGLILVEWERSDEDQLAVRIELPPGVEGEFAGPLEERRPLGSGTHEFHT
jgi:hypothetical protein